MDAATAGTSVAAFLCAAWGVFQTQRASRATQRAQAAEGISSCDLARKDAELAEMYKARAEEWKAAHDIEHAEHQAYRQRVHDERGKQQVEVLRLTEENSRLGARTDLTPLIEHIQRQSEHIQQQSQTNERVANTLTTLAGAVESLLQRIGHLAPEREHHA